MSTDELGRIKGDLDVMRRAMAPRLPYGNGMLAFGALLAVATFGGALFTLSAGSAWLPLAPFAVISTLVLVGLALRPGAADESSREINQQAMLSVVVYAVLCVAASGYAIVGEIGTSLGAPRRAALYACGVGLLFVFSSMLVHAAVRHREQRYCLGLAASTLLAGMLMPIVDWRNVQPLAHGLMAVGLLAAAGVQWLQLREAARHAAD